MRLFQILSLGTELVDELFFCLIMKPVYKRLCGWFLSLPMHHAFHRPFLSTLLSPLIPSLLNFLDLFHLLICFCFLKLLRFMSSFSLTYLPSIPFSFFNYSFLCYPHPSFPHSFAFSILPSSLTFFVFSFFLISFTVYYVFLCSFLLLP